MTILEVNDLVVRFGNGPRALNAVDHVSLEIPQRGSLGLVGESGSGKSTIARTIVGLQKPTSGHIRIDGHDIGAASLSRRQRAQQVQMIFQDPGASLNPRMTVGEAIGEALMAREALDRRAIRAGTVELLDLVRLKRGAADVYPRQLSGGMRQRVAIARCLAVKPRLIVADEITSALDASVQGAILNLIVELRAELGISMLFISHNLAVVRYVSDRIAVMHRGKVVELGDSDAVVRSPQDSYTQTLVAAIPKIENAGRGVMAANLNMEARR